MSDGRYNVRNDGSLAARLLVELNESVAPAGGLATEVTLAALLAAAATETTLADLLAAAATEPTLASILLSLGTSSAETGTVRHTTTPSKMDGATGAIEVDKRGSAFANLSWSSQRTIVLSAAGTVSSTYADSLPEGACDGIECDTDSVYVYGQFRESVDLVSRNPFAWTLGAGWNFAMFPIPPFLEAVFVHTPGNTADLELPVDATNPILVGIGYALCYTIGNCTAGTCTEKLGTAAGSARSANGTYLIALTAATNGKLIFTPSILFDGYIVIRNIYVCPRVLLPSAGVPKAASLVRILGTATKAAPVTLVASPTTQIVNAIWYRRAGAVEVT